MKSVVRGKKTTRKYRGIWQVLKLNIRFNIPSCALSLCVNQNVKRTEIKV